MNESQTKRCSKCKQNKVLEAFSIHRGVKDGRQSYCKACSKERQKQLSANGYERAKKLRQRYGLTVEQFQKMWDDQGGKCAVCEVELTLDHRNGANVDHCHETGNVRAILCWPCNRRLGVLETKRDLNAKLLEYAARFKQ